jgi:CheY-like chemotaxis protein
MANGKYKILIIDDDEFLLDMYSIKFRELGYGVEIAFSGVEALEKIKKGLEPDVILVDIVMPEMDGFEFLRQLKNAGLLKNSKRVVLSNLGQEEDIKKGKELGADDYIVKAYFTPMEVTKKIGALLNK